MADEAGVTATGAEAQVAIARIRAGMIARYRLTTVPGRPEELQQTSTGRRVSIGYGCKTIRVRLQDGSHWTAWRDYQVKEPTEMKTRIFADLTDRHFDYLVPKPPRGSQLI